MRIAKATLVRRWAWSSGSGLVLFAILVALELRLRGLTGVGVMDPGIFADVARFRAAIFAWSPEPYALAAGFNLGLSFLFLPLYAASFFYSGVIVAEKFAPRPSPLRRVIGLAAMATLAGAACNAVQNILEWTMMLNGADDGLVGIGRALGNIKIAAFAIGVLLLVGAVLAWFQISKMPPQTAPEKRGKTGA